MDVNEVVCGDPTCAPIDTVFTLVWQSGGKGVFALPLMAAEIMKEDLIDAFPVSCFCNSRISTTQARLFACQQFNCVFSTFTKFLADPFFFFPLLNPGFTNSMHHAGRRHSSPVACGQEGPVAPPARPALQGAGQSGVPHRPAPGQR